MNESELYGRIIAKYPAYKGIPQSELMPKVYAKYPQYKAVVDQPPKSTLPLKQFAAAGAPGFYMSPGSEETLPALGQALGTPGGFAGSVGGVALGEVAKQGIRAARGQGGTLKTLIPTVASTAVTEGIFRGAGKLTRPIANRLMLSVIKPGRDVIKRNPTLGIRAAELGIVGSKKGMLSKAEKVIQAGESALRSAIKGQPGVISLPNILKEIESIKRPYVNVGDKVAIDAIDEVGDALRQRMKFGQQGMIPIEEANQLKRDLYAVLKSSQFGKGFGEIPVKATARKAAAYGIKKEIEGAIPSTKTINRRMGTAIEVREALENALAGEQKRVLLPKLAAMGAGGVALAGHPLSAIGILAGDVATEYMRSAPIVTGTARNLLTLKKYGRPLTIGASEIARVISRRNQSL